MCLLTINRIFLHKEQTGFFQTMQTKFIHKNHKSLQSFDNIIKTWLIYSPAALNLDLQHPMLLYPLKIVVDAATRANVFSLKWESVTSQQR